MLKSVVASAVIACAPYYKSMKAQYDMKGIPYKEVVGERSMRLVSTRHTRPWQLIFTVDEHIASERHYVRPLGECFHEKKGEKYIMNIFFLDPKEGLL